ncbi:zinc finger protein 292-like [Scleropages formosus]|uniref:Zinc finger protein 292-like n=1 Tax=Scleropages formosus TaxID=113540 RepID=A0A0P7XED7_SCLFO|nr:zinc finger protein 292-like [Scleropages formosus]
MADDEAERDGGARSATAAEVAALRERLRELGATVTTGAQAAEAGSVVESPEQAASRYCERFCQTLVDYSSRWKIEEDPQPLVEVYTAALLSYATTAPHLSSQCEEVNLVLERLTLCKAYQFLCPQAAQSLLQQKGVSQLRMLSMVAQESGPWANATLHSILSKETPDTGRVHEFLSTEGPVLLEMRIKHLIKDNQVEKAALLARACAEHPELGREGRFQQTYLVCLCAVVPRELLMQELSKVDCRDALEMICNVESEGDEKGAFSLCSGFLTRQLLSGDMYCAWELTLFWSKLLKRLESSAQVFLDKCRQMSLLSKTVYHILFFIKVVQSEFEDVGLPVCIEMCIRALKMETEESGNTKATICKTVSCLLPSDLEVKRACQLTEFLLEPTVDSYYAVETLYNEPDQKLEEESLPVPNSLRCELLLVFKTHWPFDPEFWDWKTLKRHCLALMGEEASIVSSIDELNDSEIQDGLDDDETAKGHEFRDQIESFWDTTNELNEITDERRKKREIKKLREKGFISARFRNWQAYMQYCVLCDKEFLGHRIVRHAQTHVKDGMYSCPICAESFDSKEVLVPHVASHVKQSCKERLAAMKTSKKLANASKITVADSALQKDRLIERPIWKSKNVLNDVDLSQSNNADASALAKDEISAIRAEYTDEYSCPVANCRKGFKYFRNLIAHVKAHKNNEEAKRFLEMQSKKVVCQYCRRQFVSVVHLNDHLQVHCGVKPYICIQLNCKASFLSNTELLVHRKEHTVFKAKCMFPNCGRVFHEAYMLYDHEAQHYKTFTCREPSCGKVFHSQSQLDLHQEDHLAKEEPLTAEDHTPPVDNVDLPPQSLNGQPNNFAPKQEPSHSTPTDQEEVCEEGPQQNEPNMAANMHLCPPVPVKVKHSVESMLNPAPGPGPGQVSECSALDPNQQQFSAPRPDTSVIRSPVTACLSNPNQPRLADTSVQHDAGNMVSQDQSLLPVTYQSVLQDSNLSSQLDILQDPTQSLPLHNQGSNQSDASCVKVEGHVDNRGPVPAHHLDLFPNHNVPPSEQTPQCLSIVTPGVHPSAASTAPPQTVSLPVYGSVTSNTVSPPVSLRNPVPPEGEKERHNCAFETCTRNYSSYRSVTKHMKAAHPEFYVQWKLAKKNNRILKPIIRTVPTGGNINSVMPSQDRRLGNSQNQPGTVQSHIEPSGSWSSQPGNHADHEVVCPSHVMSSNLHPLPTQSYPSQINASGNDDEQDEPREDVKVEQESEDVQLHKFTLDKAGTLINSINLGRFQCDQPECDIFFTAFWKYIAHIEEDHKEAKFSKHYIRHGLAERYLEQQRSYFIFCKKLSRSKCKYWSSRGRAKFVDSSTETSENEDAVDTGTEASETESAKPTSRKDEIPEDAEMSDAKQSTDDSSDTKSVASATIKRRRGRPRKEDCEERLTRSKAMERLRTRSSTVSCVGNGSDSTNSSSGTGPANEEQHDQTITLSSFKPMGFEVSFLKFLEESTQSPTKRKAIEELTSEIPLKRERTIQLKTATVLCKRSDVYVRPKAEQNCIDFRNPQKLTSLKNVKIVVDNAFSHVADLLLKQLQEMRPLVILQK